MLFLKTHVLHEASVAISRLLEPHSFDFRITCVWIQSASTKLKFKLSKYLGS